MKLYLNLGRNQGRLGGYPLTDFWELLVVVSMGHAKVLRVRSASCDRGISDCIIHIDRVPQI